MYIFESRFKNLTFYYEGKIKKFSCGRYATENKEEAEVLKKSKSVNLVEEPSKRGRKPKEED